MMVGGEGASDCLFEDDDEAVLTAANAVGVNVRRSRADGVAADTRRFPAAVTAAADAYIGIRSRTVALRTPS